MNMEELTLARKDKRKLGQFYTPETIVEYMVRCLDIGSNSTILDSSCGCGVFLVKTFLYLKKKYKTSAIIKNIYGVDLNGKAVVYTRKNLQRFAGNKFKNIICNNIKVGNSIDSKGNNFVWHNEFPNVFKKGGFDYVIGNPPYVTLKRDFEYNNDNKTYSHVVKGVINSATLITATGYDLLTHEGELIFLLPKSITRVKSYFRLRKFLLANTEIIKIFDLGAMFKDVRGEQVILLFKKKHPTNKRHITVSRYLDKDKTLEEQPKVEITQKQYARFNNFPILANPKLYNIAYKLSNIGEKLDNLCKGKIFRGISIPRDVRKDEKYENCTSPAISGNTIKKFTFKNKFYIDENALSGNLKNKIERLKSKKVVLQNIYSAESGIKAVYDNKGLITAETVTNIIVDTVNPKYLLAILSSKLINFFLTFVIYNGSLLTMHTDREYIGQIPIIVADTKDQKKLVSLVDRILKNPTSLKNYLRKIDSVVYNLYKIDQPSINAIDSALKNIMSKRSYW